MVLAKANVRKLRINLVGSSMSLKVKLSQSKEGFVERSTVGLLNKNQQSYNLTFCVCVWNVTRRIILYTYFSLDVCAIVSLDGLTNGLDDILEIFLSLPSSGDVALAVIAAFAALTAANAANLFFLSSSSLNLDTNISHVCINVICIYKYTHFTRVESLKLEAKISSKSC